MTNSSKVEPYTMDGGNITAVKTDSNGVIEVFEISPTSFQEFPNVSALLQNYLTIRREAVIAQSRCEVTAKEIITATKNHEAALESLAVLQDKYNDAERKLTFVQLKVIQKPGQTEPIFVKTSKPEPIKPAAVSSYNEVTERLIKIRKDLTEPRLAPPKEEKKPEPKLEPKPEQAVIKIGHDTSGLVKSEERKITAPKETGIEPMGEQPKPEPVQMIQKAVVPSKPTSPKEWAKYIYTDVLNDLVRRNQTEIDQNDLVIEITSRGIPKELVTATAEEILKMLKDKGVIPTPMSKITSIFKRKK